MKCRKDIEYKGISLGTPPGLIMGKSIFFTNTVSTIQSLILGEEIKPSFVSQHFVDRQAGGIARRHDAGDN